MTEQTVTEVLKRHRFSAVPVPGNTSWVRGRATGSRWVAIIEADGGLTVNKAGERWPPRGGRLEAATTLPFEDIDLWLYELIRT